jgi:arabinogalactan endo-1,4-beta-galactosidase
LSAISLQELEDGWQTYLDELEVESLNIVRTDDYVKPARFQKGFCYAHEGYQIYNGYLSRKSFESLEKLRSLGVEWISLSPFGYLKDRNKPSYLIYSFGAGSENDESIIAAFHAAKKLGMGVMLKPHVLMHSGNWGWPGEIKMTSEKDWQKFFKYYYRWIRHYALLAEMYNVDILCIGVELVHATQGHEAEWRKLISQIKQIYHGPLVYAANWGQEFENLSFWDDLDYIGLNCYYPLSTKNSATLEDLKIGAEKILPKIEKVAKKYHKPVLLTEIGFTSTAHPWKNPHKRNRGASVVLEDQALAYRAMFEAFWDKPWFYGFYWWKWPTYLEYGGKNHNGFTPNGKPAEEVVKEWYLKKKVPKLDHF